MLEAKGRVRFSSPCLDWIKTSAGLLRLEVLPISPEIAVESTRLPGGFHGDPADRLIVSTTRVENCVLLTQDELIREYARNGLVRVITEA
ncbi:Ribonuclease VapC22 [compost metagenome]